MFKLMIAITVLAALTLAVTAYAVSSSSSTDRIDCPGKIVCPMTGELVCKDRCPLGETPKEEEQTLPSCCQNAK